MGQEENHEINTPEAINFIHSLKLTQEEINTYREVVDVVFQAYADLMNSFLVYAHKRSSSQLLQVA